MGKYQQRYDVIANRHGNCFYSNGAVKDIPIGEDYLNREYWDAQKVGDHICAFFIEVVGNEINVADLYWLMNWQNNCPKEQQIEVEPGFYHLKFSGEQPKFAMKEEFSDEEYDELLDKPCIIYIHINRLETMPENKWKGGVPYMYWAYEKEQVVKIFYDNNVDTNSGLLSS